MQQEQEIIVKETWDKEIWVEHFDNISFKKGYLEHSHPNYEIAFFVKACTSEFIKDISHEIRDGDLVLIDEYEFHRIMAKEDELHSGYVVHFKKAFIDKFLKLFKVESILEKIFKRNAKVVTLNLKQREMMEALFSALLRTYEKYACNSFDNTLHATLTAQLFTLLAAALKHIPPDTAVQHMSKTGEVIRKIITYIDQHYPFSLSLDQISQDFNLSKYYLSHIFKEHTGFTIFEYIIQKRITEAKKLLLNTSLPVEAICRRSGFVSKQYFYKVFKRISGTSPTAFRKGGGNRMVPQAG